MLNALLLGTSLLAGALPAGGVAADPPIVVRLNSDGRYLPGDAGRVEIRTDEDGYLLVLQAADDGTLRVLFPLDPADDAFVKAGKTYQLKNRSGNQDVFRTAHTSGGLVLAALSRQPLNVQSYVKNKHWDYSVLKVESKGDVESQVQALASQIAGDQLTYDVASFDVVGSAYAAGGRYVNSTLAIGYGWPGWYGAPYYYDPYYGGLGFGWGYGYGYPYYGYGYGYGYPYYGGGFGGWGGGVIVVPGGGHGGVGRPTRGFGNRSWGGRGAAPSRIETAPSRGSQPAPVRSAPAPSPRVESAPARGGGRSWRN